MALKQTSRSAKQSEETADGATSMARPAGATRGKRDAAATKERILRAGMAEFSRNGFNGARIERIAQRAQSNIRMIYHYFGGKEKLYLAVLERVYQRVRSAERQLHLDHLDPEEGMARMIDFTFGYLIDNPEFVSLISSENLMRGKFLKKSQIVPETTLPLVETLRDLLLRGERSGVFRKRVDPVQLYVTILSVCFVHVSNRFTLSIMFQKDMADKAWLDARRAHAKELVLGYLTGLPAAADLPAAVAPVT